MAPELEAPGPGDFDGDGDVDGEDFLIWQRNFDAGALAASTAVPEPGTVLLAMLGLVLAARRRHSRRFNAVVTGS